MKKSKVFATSALSAAIAALVGSVGVANATEPCGDFGECKALVEINSSDGDIGFHFLMDGDDLILAALYNPDREKIFKYFTKRELREQTLTETFAESAEPLCFDPTTDDDPDNDDEDFVTLEEFLDRWQAGKYRFYGFNEDWELSRGMTRLTFKLPAAPEELEWSVEPDEHEPGEFEYEISWEAGEDLGECADADALDDLVESGALPQHPEHVKVAAWEIVLEPDVDDGDPLGGMKYTVRIPGDADELEIEVPDDYLEALGEENVPAKMEVGAIGVDDNATFTEEDEICLNDTDPFDDDDDGLNGCGFEVDEEDGDE
jgi:hypothetical protein